MIETRWTKKLEDYGESHSEEDTDGTGFRFRIPAMPIADNDSRRLAPEADQSQEQLLDSMLKNGVRNNFLMKKRNQAIKKKGNSGKGGESNVVIDEVEEVD